MFMLQYVFDDSLDHHILYIYYRQYNAGSVSGNMAICCRQLQVKYVNKDFFSHFIVSSA